MTESVHDSSLMGLLIASISEAARWSEVAAAIGRHLGRDAVALVTRDDHGFAALVGSDGFATAALRAALASVVLPVSCDLTNPANAVSPVQRKHLPRGHISPPHRLCGWWLPNCGQPAYVLTTADGETDSIPGPLIQLVEPVSRALGAHLRLRRAELRSSELQNLVDGISVGSIITDDECRIIAANRSAERLIASNEELGCWGGLLRARCLGDTKRLHAAIWRCSRGEKLCALRFGNPPRAVQVLITRSQGEKRRALVFLMEARVTPPVDAGYLSTIYRLTPAEIRLIQALLRGHNLTQAARQLELSRNTVHSQLKAIFAKTQTNRQGELISLILRSPTAMYREPSGEFTRDGLEHDP